MFEVILINKITLHSDEPLKLGEQTGKNVIKIFIKLLTKNGSHISITLNFYV